MTKIKLDQQFLFVKFPIIFPLIYAFILYSFPNYETGLIILTILLLAETHFGATWPFFLDKVNHSFIVKNRIPLITMPIIITILSLLGFFFINKFFLLIFFAANMFHVTRQSFGITKLYCKDIEENKFQELCIYLVNFIFFIIGFFRFYLPIIDQPNLIYLNIFVLFLFIFSSIYYLFKFGYSENFFIFLTGCLFLYFFVIILTLILVLIFELNKFGFSENFLTLITGVLIFYPVCFVSNPVHAIIMGVTMHYTQYLYLTYNVCKSRKDNLSEINTSTFYKKAPNYIVTILIYASVMTVFSILGKSDEIYLKQLIIIPIIGQMLHFYLDSQLWKFSDKHNRDNTLSYLTKIIN